MLLVALGLASVLAQSAVQVAAPTVVTGRIVDDASRAGISDARVTLIPMPDDVGRSVRRGHKSTHDAHDQ